MKEPEKYLESRLPSLDELKRYIEEMEAFDLSTISTDELAKKLHSYFPILNYSEVFWDSEYHIYRARRNYGNMIDKPYNNLCNISLPPSDKTPFGRANNEFEPIFYGSIDSELTLFESCQNISEQHRFTPQNFTMGIWKIKDDQMLRLAPIIDSDLITENRKDIQTIREKNDQLSSSVLTSEKVIKGSKMVSKFFADQFAKSNIKTTHDYKISAFFSKVIKDANKLSDIKFDGILYPSVAHKFKSDNIAIFPESLHKIEIVKCFSLTCYNFNYEAGTFTSGVFREGIPQGNGEINWS